MSNYEWNTIYVSIVRFHPERKNGLCALSINGKMLMICLVSIWWARLFGFEEGRVVNGKYVKCCIS